MDLALVLLFVLIGVGGIVYSGMRSPMTKPVPPEEEAAPATETSEPPPQA